jgi:prephenate dehydrogenase
MVVSVIGLGLLGGSFALGFQAKYQKPLHIIGVDTNQEHAEEALNLGICDEILSLNKAIPRSDLVVLATPVSTIEQLLPTVLDCIQPDAVVTDLGSTKGNICDAVANHPNRKRYIAAHPIAGTEFSGPSSAFPGLLRNKIMILCNTDHSAPSAVKWLEFLFTNLFCMNLQYMEAHEHDLHLAYVSHLSHAISFALSNTVLDKEKDESSILALAGSGFSSTVRLAKSSPEMWAPIFLQNHRHMHEALNAYIGYLQEFSRAIQAGDENKLLSLMRQSNAIIKVLDR